MTDRSNDAFSQRAIARWRVALWSLAALLLIVPVLATRFIDAMRWGAEDVLTLCAMLLIAGGAVEITVRASRRRVVVIGVVLLVGAAFLLTWAELAVGLFR